MLNNVTMLWSVYHCMHGTYFLLMYFVSQCIVPSHTLAVDASSSYVCTNEWLLTANTLCPLSLFCKKGASSKSQLRSKQSSTGPYPENFMTIGGCFKCYTYRIMLPALLKKEEQWKKEMKRWTILIFDHFRFATLNYTLLIVLQTGASSVSGSVYF